MPILDVTMGDEPIISGGVVSAEGYDPIVITKTEENTPKDPLQPESKDKDPKIEIKEETLIFGFEPTTVIFSVIFLILVAGLFVASCVKSCNNPLHDERPKSDRSKAYLA
jgi:hypothetical protein